MHTPTFLAAALVLAALPAWGEDLPAFGTPVDNGQLEALRGGSDTAGFSAIHVQGTTSGNDAQNVVTGTNTIRDGALDNVSGLPIVIQNSGANVLIQNAVIVNVNLH